MSLAVAQHGDAPRKIGVQLSDWHVLSENCLVVSNFQFPERETKKAIFFMLNILRFPSSFPNPPKNVGEMPSRSSRWLPSRPTKIFWKTAHWVRCFTYEKHDKRCPVQTVALPRAFHPFHPPKIAAFRCFFSDFFIEIIEFVPGRSQVDLLPQLVHRLSS